MGQLSKSETDFPHVAYCFQYRDTFRGLSFISRAVTLVETDALCYRQTGCGDAIAADKVTSLCSYTHIDNEVMSQQLQSLEVG